MIPNMKSYVYEALFAQFLLLLSHSLELRIGRADAVIRPDGAEPTAKLQCRMLRGEPRISCW